MNTLRSRILAVVEVTLALAVVRVGLIPWVLPRLVTNKIALVFVNYLVIIIVPILIILARRERLADYGLHLRALRSQMDIALAAFVPYALLMAVNDWLIPERFPGIGLRWEGALISSLFFLFLLWLVIRLTRNKPGPIGLLPFLIFMLPLQQGAGPLSERLLAFIYYLCFVGPGEEIFFRGYMQTRLNRAFGCPYAISGVPYGWGALLTCLLFGAMHYFNGYNPLSGSIQFSLWWAIPAAVAGLLFAYLREKSGGVAAPALVHGLPQAIASLMLGFFAVR